MNETIIGVLFASAIAAAIAAVLDAVKQRAVVQQEKARADKAEIRAEAAEAELKNLKINLKPPMKISDEALRLASQPRRP